MSTPPINGVDHDRSRHFTAHVIESLREDYRLRPDEADKAVGLYLRRKAGFATPDQAALEAYRWWAPTVAPNVVIAREAEQRAHARQIGQPDSSPIDSAIDTVDEDADRSRSDVAQADLAAAQSALDMIRDQGQRHGFTTDQVELARQLRQVLDESPVWDTITPSESAPKRLYTDVDDLEPALRPDTVRERDGWDDMIVIDAAFAGTIVTVLRAPGGVGPSSYVFMCDSPGGRGAQQTVDVTKIGMIAAGDRAPDPARAGEYENLGNQVRNHLIGLAGAVAESREAWQEQQANRLHTARAALESAGVDTGRGPQRAALGRAR